MISHLNICETAGEDEDGKTKNEAVSLSDTPLPHFHPTANRESGRSRKFAGRHKRRVRGGELHPDPEVVERGPVPVRGDPAAGLGPGGDPESALAV